MATNNMLNLPLSGSTGSGNFVGANTPTLVTPVGGVISATSMNFGQSALSYYGELIPWTPVFNFVTPGNLSIVYTLQSGYYTRVGNMIYIWAELDGTPTFTTSSGNLIITGLPFAVNALVDGIGNLNINSAGPTYPAGTTQVYTRANFTGTVITAVGHQSAVGNTNITATNFTSGVPMVLACSMVYLI